MKTILIGGPHAGLEVDCEPPALKWIRAHGVPDKYREAIMVPSKEIETKDSLYTRRLDGRFHYVGNDGFYHE